MSFIPKYIKLDSKSGLLVPDRERMSASIPTPEEREQFFTDTMPNTDNVNHPSHYKAYSLENLETIKGSMSSQEYFGFLKGNTLKYLYRYQLKNKPIEDLEKAEFYLKELIKEWSK